MCDVLPLAMFFIVMSIFKSAPLVCVPNCQISFIHTGVYLNPQFTASQKQVLLHRSNSAPHLGKLEGRMKLLSLVFLLLAFLAPPASFSGEGELCDICIDLVGPGFKTWR